MAGKAAVLRRGWQNAREHFDWIITNGPLCVVLTRPGPVVAEAYIARATCWLSRATAPRILAGYAEATNAFAKVALQFPQTEWRRGLGDGSATAISSSPRLIPGATRCAEAYRRSWIRRRRRPAEHGRGGVGPRARAAAALEPKRASRPYDAAITHYLNVVYEKNLRPSELADPSWLRQAGLNASSWPSR
jgi:hypothetical protein